MMNMVGGQQTEEFNSQLQLGNELFETDAKRALTAYTQAVRLEPTHIESWNQIGRLMFDLQQYSEAEQVFEKVEELANQQGLADWAEMAAGNVELTRETRLELEASQKASPETQAAETQAPEKATPEDTAPQAETAEVVNSASNEQTVVEPAPENGQAQAEPSASQNDESGQPDQEQPVVAQAEPSNPRETNGETGGTAEPAVREQELDASSKIENKTGLDEALKADPAPGVKESMPVLNVAETSMETPELVVPELAVPKIAVPDMPAPTVTAPDIAASKTEPVTAQIQEAAGSIAPPQVPEVEVSWLPEQEEQKAAPLIGDQPVSELAIENIMEHAAVAPSTSEPFTEPPQSIAAPNPVSPTGQAAASPQSPPSNTVPVPPLPPIAGGAVQAHLEPGGVPQSNAAISQNQQSPNQGGLQGRQHQQGQQQGMPLHPAVPIPPQNMPAPPQAGQIPPQMGQIPPHMMPDAGMGPDGKVADSVPVPPTQEMSNEPSDKTGGGKKVLMAAGLVGAIGIGVSAAYLFSQTEVPKDGQIPVVKSAEKLVPKAATPAVIKPKQATIPSIDKVDRDQSYKVGMTFLVKGEFQKALPYLEKAHDQGHAEASYNLASLYAKGDGVDQSYEKAVSYLNKSVEGKYYPAMTNLGLLHAQGRGVPQSYQKARELWEKAAAGEHPDAMHNLAVIYATGKGVDKNMTEAIKWYRKGANAGFVDSMANLGLLYANGDGVTRDYNEAKRLWEMAAAKGHATSAQNLEKLKQVMAKKPSG